MKTLALLPLLLASLAATAQTADPWLCSQNAAALTRFAGRNVATAELSMAKGKGGFTNYYDSPDALTVSATVSSVFRLNQKTVAFGAMGYDNFSGRDMAGSAFSPLTPHLSPLTSHLSPLLL